MRIMLDESQINFSTSCKKCFVKNFYLFIYRDIRLRELKMILNKFLVFEITTNICLGLKNQTLKNSKTENKYFEIHLLKGKKL